MKLELKHLAPYQEHKVKLLVDGRKYNIAYLSTKRIAFIDIQGYGDVEKMKWEYASGKVQPILRPLSDLTKEIEHNGKKFTMVYKLKEYQRLIHADLPEKHNELDDRIDLLMKEIDIFGCFILQLRSYFIIRQLISKHFDVFGLIEQNLAIDINTVGGL